VKDKVCVTTGRTDGIGKAAGYGLAVQGARTLIGSLLSSLETTMPVHVSAQISAAGYGYPKIRFSRVCT
jgi:NAD(P)-dependent dehydrogenase (short-subunit alcohol dehydrogenase family)